MTPLVQQFLRLLWPSFLIAGIAEMIFFSIFNPDELLPFGHSVEAGRLAVYSIGFLGFWLISAAAGLLAVWMSKGAPPD